MNSSGTLVITLLEKHKLILSPQSPVRQIWIAFRDRAWHLSLDQASGKWLDDRGEGKELFSLVASLVAPELWQAGGLTAVAAFSAAAICAALLLLWLLRRHAEPDAL